MNSFRNNYKRNRFRSNGDRNFKKRDGDSQKFNSDYSTNINFQRKYPGKNNHNASRLVEKYTKNLINYSKITSFSNIGNIYYLFPTNKKSIVKLTTKAKESDALTFAYGNQDLENGVMSSLIIDSKVKPILNLDAIKSSNITLRPVLLKISKIYKKEEI